MEDRDIIAMARDEQDAVVQVFFIREGKLIGRDHFHLSGGHGGKRRGDSGQLCQAVLRRNPLYPQGAVAPACRWMDEEVISQLAHRNGGARR